MSSVRFICGTQALHLELEKRIAAFLGMEDAILYAACFDANGGVFEPLLGADDAIVTDQLNHASIIDGVRLCKAKRFVYANADMADLEAKLEEAQACRFRLIVTDGVFSMDGTVAPLPQICDLAERYRATADGGRQPRHRLHGEDRPRHVGAPRRRRPGGPHHDHLRQGARRGARAAAPPGSREVIGMLRQRSRPYLFSNSLAPAVVGATLRALELLTASTELRDRLEANTKTFRERMTAAGLRDQARRPPDRADHVLALRPRRRAARPALRAGPARRGRLREGLLLPGRGEGPLADPRPALGRAPPGAHRPGGRGLHEGRAALGVLAG